MTSATFQKVGQSDRRMFGPSKIVVCGFSPEDQKKFLDMLASLGATKLPVVFPTDDQSEMLVGDILELPDRSGEGAMSALARAVVLSGLTEVQLHAILRTYRETGMPTPLWATLTEVSVNWPLSELLKELAVEREAFRSQGG